MKIFDYCPPTPSISFSFPPSSLQQSLQHLALGSSRSLETGFSSAFTRYQVLPLRGDCPVQNEEIIKLKMAGESSQTKQGFADLFVINRRYFCFASDSTEQISNVMGLRTACIQGTPSITGRRKTVAFSQRSDIL